MENEIIKKTIRVGNSAGVLLPKEWLNTEVKIILQPLDIEKDIIDILRNEDKLSEIEGVYLTGSYSRGEQTVESDVDVLIITNNINERIKRGRYDILFVSKKEIEHQLKNNALPILPMLKEAQAIINKNLIKRYLNTVLTWKNLKWHIETTNRMMDEVLEDINFAKKTNCLISDASAYSLILRLRTLYIIDALRKNETLKTKGLLSLIKKVSGSDISYKRYLQSKNYSSAESKLSISEAEKLRNYIINKTPETKKWLKEKKD
jgi:predicted nucleotidyltransferase